MLFTESFAREKQVSYAWNSTAYRPNSEGLGRGLGGDVYILLKQGLKIGYLPPSRYNCKFIY